MRGGEEEDRCFRGFLVNFSLWRWRIQPSIDIYGSRRFEDFFENRNLQLRVINVSEYI